MAKISTNAEINSIRLKEQASAPDTPASGYFQVYVKTDGKLYYKDDAGTEVCLTDKLTNPMTTAGDIIYGGASGAPTRLAAGTENYVLTMGAANPEWAITGSGLGDMTWAIVQASQLINEVMNFPSLENADGTLPEWWEVGSNATLTEEDITGESITENYKRGLKVVTTADDSYGYQRYTYADQQRIKSGRKLSVIFAVWSVSSAVARIRLQSSVGSLGVSSDTTVAGWTILKVEGVTLDGTYVDIRCECDSGTAYFIPLGINIGEKSVPLPVRMTHFRNCEPTLVKALTGLGDEAAWTDIDLTPNSSALAIMAKLSINLFEETINDIFELHLRRNGASTTANDGSCVAKVYGTSGFIRDYKGERLQVLDDGQVFEYYFDRVGGSGTLTWGQIWLQGWWEWE